MKKSVNQLREFFAPEHYDLILDINREKREFRGTVKIRGQKVGAENIRLHAKGLSIDLAKIGDNFAKAVPRNNDEIELVFRKDIGEQQNITLEIDFTGKIIANSMHGLYPCYYELDGAKKELLATQFESHHAREVFPCVDEPAAKATFDLTLITEKNVEVLSNSEKLWQKNLKNKLATKFATTPKMSTYLLAFVIGDLQKVSRTTARGVAVNVFATFSQPPESLKFAAEVATKSIDFYEDYFGVNYPLAKSDHVALPDFSAGAMENWGLITYRETALLTDHSESLGAKQYIATVVAHELAHQWFGDLVTMKWWNDLWLNESFASLMEHIATDALFPDWDMWLDYETGEVVAALRRDALPGVQPVQQDVNHPDEISTLFDSAIVYAKGERLLKMLRAVLGDETFRVGLKNYFAKFAYQNTIANDLWNCLSAAANFDVAKLMTPWLTQPGYPVISAGLVRDKVILTQTRFLSTGESDNTLWPIPLFSDDKNAPKIIDSRTTEFAPANLAKLQFNTGNLGHFITALDPKLRAKLNNDFSKFSVADRLLNLNQTMMLARAGRAPTTDLIDILLASRNEQNHAVWDALASAVQDLRKVIENDEIAINNLKQLVARIAQPLFAKLGATTKNRDDINATKLRPIILSEMIFSEDRENVPRPAIRETLKIYAQHRENLANFDGNLRPVILAAVVKFGDPAEFSYLLNLYKSTSDPALRQDICSGLSAAREPGQIAKLLDSLTDSEIVRPQDLFYWFIWLLGNQYSRAETWRWCRENWPWISETFGGDKSFDMFPRAAGQILRTSAELAEFREFFAPLKAEPSLKRAIEIGEADIESRIAWITRDREIAIAKLAEIRES